MGERDKKTALRRSSSLSRKDCSSTTHLVRWGKSQDDCCPLCGQKQSNLHMLSNCSSTAALANYKDRHNAILELFQSYCPDIAINDPPNVFTLELTVCHEENLLKSRECKEQKYSNLENNLHEQYLNCNLRNFTIEVSTLGFISDNSTFCQPVLNQKLLTTKIKTKLKTKIKTKTKIMFTAVGITPSPSTTPE